MVFTHTPAMLDEVIHYLDPKTGGVYVDGTLGGSGHASAIINIIGPEGTLIGIDQDIDAICHARQLFMNRETRVILVHDNFAALPHILDELEIMAVDGILVDIGLSQHQLSESGRGFSFMKNEPLDMRMDVRNGITAEELVNTLDEKELADIFFRLGEEKFSRQIARAIVQRRKTLPVRTSLELARIVEDTIPVKAARTQKIHPATRVFQALRIYVNKELTRLSEFLDHVDGLLKPGGRLCVLSFHSLEDRIVKEKFRELENPCTCPPDFPVCACGRIKKIRSLTRKVVRPTEEEITRNPMARSTRLRAFEKI